MAKTTNLILTEENRAYLIGFLSDYANECFDNLNLDAKAKLLKLIKVLIPNDDIELDSLVSSISKQ